MKFTVSEIFQQSRPPDVIVPGSSTRRPNLARLAPIRGLFLLLFSSAISEVACNIVYIVLIERAYLLGGGPASIGIVMILQSTAQVFFGSWMGGLADQLRFKRAAIIAISAIAALVFSLTFAKVVTFVYIIAFLIMLGGFLFVPEWFIKGGWWSIGVGLIFLGLNAARYFNGLRMSGFTTFLGLLPMIFETSIQALFLVPMAISLGIGTLVSSAVILLLIPAIFALGDEARQRAEELLGDDSR